MLRLIIGRFGIRGILFLVVIGAGLYAAGVNPVALLQQQQAGVGVAQAPANDETTQFVSTVLAETEDVWSHLFSDAGGDYPEPTLVLFSASVSSARGYASSASGPFYCPADQKLYLDTSFFRELAQRFGAPGDFAAAYVIAHEVGHHVQNVTGVLREVRTAQQAARNQGDANAMQVRVELQADCYAGIWAYYADRISNILDDGDIEEGLRAAAAIGDDTLQRNAGRQVTPESFTQGTSEQRQRWFVAGYRSGAVGNCDTFEARSL